MASETGGYIWSRRGSTASNMSGMSTPTGSVMGDAPRGHKRSSRSLSVQEKVFAKLLSTVSSDEIEQIAEEVEDEIIEEEVQENKAEDIPHVPKAGFSLPKINLNLIELNQRIGHLFEQQEYTVELFTWKRPHQTLCVLAIWVLICLNPHLIPVVPLLAQLYLVMMPAFLARHPAAANDPRAQPINFGPPTAPAPNIRPVSVASRDFIRNMRDLQRSLDDLKKGHIALTEHVIPQFNFSDEGRTTEIFIATWVLAAFAFMTIHLIPWTTILLFGGSAGIIAGHPFVHELLHAPEKASQKKKQMQDLQKKVKEFIEQDCILDEPPPVRQVEMFELQRHKAATNTWEPWLFSPTPYDPLSPARINGSRPRGTQFFQDVLPPAGWKWKHKKWTMDRSSTEWVQERLITGVEVETQGEAWVYDIPPEDEEEYLSAIVASTTAAKDKAKAVAKSGWEEASGIEKRGEWRRRRWTRDVERKTMQS